VAFSATITPSSAVRLLQAALQAGNFYAGAVDGIYGLQTQQAMQMFQYERGLEPSLYPSAATLKKLGLPPEDWREVLVQAAAPEAEIAAVEQQAKLEQASGITVEDPTPVVLDLPTSGEEVMVPAASAAKFGRWAKRNWIPLTLTGVAVGVGVAGVIVWRRRSRTTSARAGV